MSKTTAIHAAFFSILFFSTPATADEPKGVESAAVQPTGGVRERVQGIGGFFFRAKDPKALAAWYDNHLGVTPTPTDYDQVPWKQEAGETVFAPFPATTKYFGRSEQAWMINFRVRDLAAMVKQLRDAAIAVEVDPEEYPNGLFARLEDPEGNPIQLWQPMGGDSTTQKELRN